MIESEQHNAVLTLRLAHGKASALDIDLLTALGDALQQARQDAHVRALILTGSGSIFSGGVDLKKILEGEADYAHRFIPLLDATLEAVFSFPKPVVAAINGHAIAGGGILAMAADVRLMTQAPARIGVPELKVGVPFPAAAFEIVRFAVPGTQVEWLMYGGETYLPEAALARGMVNELVEADALMARAQVVAETLAAIPASSFQLTKQMQRESVIARIHAQRNQHGQAILDSWSHDATYDHIRGYLEATLKK